MKQTETAVEYLIEVFFKSNIEKSLFQDEINKAKEMEKQQKGYSEDEVVNCIQYTLDNFFNGKLAGLNSKEIFEQFNNKKNESRRINEAKIFDNRRLS